MERYQSKKEKKKKERREKRHKYDFDWCGNPIIETKEFVFYKEKITSRLNIIALY